jgi:hypothetical protein
VAGEIEPVRVVEDAVEYGIGVGGIAKTVQPPIRSAGSLTTNPATGSASEGIAGAPDSGTTVISGGHELGGDGTPAEGKGVFLSGGGMMQLDSLLSQIAGVISGFDLGDDIGPHSLGFGPPSSGMSWMREPSGADAPRVGKEGNIFNLSLLGQYSAANFNAGADSHGGTLLTDPPASSSVVETPLVVHHP